MRITLPNPKKLLRVFESVTGTALNANISGICTDSRYCIDGDLYIAIKGNNVDGNDFVHDAKSNGAVAALVSNDAEISGIQFVKVDDPVATIGTIANKWRKQFNIPVIGITGSNGKTTTKDLIRHFLEAKLNVHSTKGNFNTSIGLPLTLLRLEERHQISVLEMGASEPGDIKLLCKIAQPTDGLITNIGPAHLEGFGTIENIFNEKSELFRALDQGRIFKNVSDDYIKTIPTHANTIEFGCVANCDYPVDYSVESDGNIILIVNTHEINLNTSNSIFAKNVLAAAVVARTFGIDWDTIQKKINDFTPSYGRYNKREYDGITVIDDTYNANFTSTATALDNLAQLNGNGRKIFVFGDMAELGKYSQKYHRMIGEKCNDIDLDAVFTIGNETLATNNIIRGNNHFHYDTHDLLSADLKNFIKKGDTILFKGSRSMEIEKIIQEVFKN